MYKIYIIPEFKILMNVPLIMVAVNSYAKTYLALSNVAAKVVYKLIP